MKLPNHENAFIPETKIVDYLLSLTHPDGRGKAIFFRHFGFSINEWNVLAAALMNHAAAHEIAKTERSPFGTRYVIEGELETPIDREPFVRTVWFVDIDDDVPRFVTAYPINEENDDDSSSGT